MATEDDRPTDVQDVVGVEDHLAPGTDVGGYILDGELGAGGMGVVYSATHPVIGKRAAIKVLKPELSDNPAAVERFIIEARAVNQIGHPNIVDIFAFGTLPDGRSYYVMDFLTGETLRARLQRGALHIAEAATILDDIASALIAAHDKGIIHRDLKPDNVFVVSIPGRWPEVRLLDWGLLKLSSAQSAISSGKYRTLAGSVFGTPVYMSPEQARASDRVDARTDIYSLGVVAFEMLAGTVPFRGGSSIDTLLAHQEEPIPSLAARCPGVPDEVVQLIEAMLSKTPEGRPTLAAVRAVIKRLRGSKIPTMTAAGLELPSNLGAISPLGSSPVIPLTPSIAFTRERLPTPHPVERNSAPVLPTTTLAPPAAPARLPAPTPGSPSVVGSLSIPLDAASDDEPPPLPDQPSVSPYDNMQVQVQAPVVAASPALRAPPPAAQRTLAGVSMPGVSSPRLAVHPTPTSVPVQRASQPAIQPAPPPASDPALAPAHAPYTAAPPSGPATAAPVCPPAPSPSEIALTTPPRSRLVYVVIAGLVLAAVGVTLALVL